MKSEKMKSFVEVHICNYLREGDECCFDKGAKDLTDKLKKWAKEETNKEVRVFRSGCLGKCSEGIAVACYPSKKMFLEVHQNDYKELRHEVEEMLKEAKEG